MTALREYRDDGPLAEQIAKVVATAPRAGSHPLAWLAPPLLRALEYGFLVALTALTDPDAMPACFAFLSVLAFHHYDTIYRERHQGTAPPAWVRAVGGGWDGRVVVASLLAAAGVLGPGFLAAAVALAFVYVAESALSWIRSDRPEPRPVEDEDEALE